MTFPEILSDLLDRTRAALIAEDESLGITNELRGLVLGEIDAEDYVRAKALIPALEMEVQQQDALKEAERKKAERAKPRERKQTDLEKRNRVTLFGWHLCRLLQVFPGTTVPDSLWGRLWAKVVIPEGPGVLAQCWLWQGALSKKRRSLRGVIQLAGRGSRVVIVCRLICEWFHGPAPTEKHEAGHICPTGEEALCCNPTHLAWQTREENEDHKRRPLRTGVDAPFKGHAPTCQAYGNYQPPYEECTCGAES